MIINIRVCEDLFESDNECYCITPSSIENFDRAPKYSGICFETLELDLPRNMELLFKNNFEMAWPFLVRQGDPRFKSYHIIGLGSWFPDNRITRYKRLKGLWKMNHDGDSFDIIYEFMLESANKISFLGIANIDHQTHFDKLLDIYKPNYFHSTIIGGWNLKIANEQLREFLSLYANSVLDGDLKIKLIPLMEFLDAYDSFFMIVTGRYCERGACLNLLMTNKIYKKYFESQNLP